MPSMSMPGPRPEVSILTRTLDTPTHEADPLTSLGTLNPAVMPALTPRSPVQKLLSGQSTKEPDAINRLEVGTDEKARNNVDNAVEAGEGKGRCNPILVSPKSNLYGFKSNHSGIGIGTPQVPCPLGSHDLPFLKKS